MEPTYTPLLQIVVGVATMMLAGFLLGGLFHDYRKYGGAYFKARPQAEIVPGGMFWFLVAVAVLVLLSGYYNLFG